MTNLLFNFIITIVIAIVAVGISILWRTCIYTRGSIFRPIGRILDIWVNNAFNPEATFKHKILRFIAYPLGRCIYCSSFHIGYYTFFYINNQFHLNLNIEWLIILLPIEHLFVIMFMKMFIVKNNDMKVGDWYVMMDDDNNNKIFDLPIKKNKYNSPLSKEEEIILEKSKLG